EYEQERPATHRPALPVTMARQSSSGADAVSMRYAHVRGLDKPVSQLVMGCDNQPGMSHAAVMWDHFFAHGGNAFDTAWLYGGGAMEQLLGHWHRSRGVRDELVIVGKGAHTPHCFPEAIATQLTESLERL